VDVFIIGPENYQISVQTKVPYLPKYMDFGILLTKNEYSGDPLVQIGFSSVGAITDPFARFKYRSSPITVTGIPPNDETGAPQPIQLTTDQAIMGATLIRTNAAGVVTQQKIITDVVNGDKIQIVKQVYNYLETGIKLQVLYVDSNPTITEVYDVGRWAVVRTEKTPDFLSSDDGIGFDPFKTLRDAVDNYVDIGKPVVKKIVNQGNTVDKPKYQLLGAESASKFSVKSTMQYRGVPTLASNANFLNAKGSAYTTNGLSPLGALSTRAAAVSVSYLAYYGTRQYTATPTYISVESINTAKLSVKYNAAIQNAYFLSPSPDSSIQNAYFAPLALELDPYIQNAYFTTPGLDSYIQNAFFAYSVVDSYIQNAYLAKLENTKHLQDAYFVSMGNSKHLQDAYLATIGTTKHFQEAYLAKLGNSKHLQDAYLATIGTTKHFQEAYLAKLGNSKHFQEAYLATIGTTKHFQEAYLATIGNTKYFQEAYLTKLGNSKHYQETYLTKLGNSKHYQEAYLTKLGSSKLSQEVYLAKLGSTKYSSNYYLDFIKPLFHDQIDYLNYIIPMRPDKAKVDIIYNNIKFDYLYQVTWEGNDNLLSVGAFATEALAKADADSKGYFRYMITKILNKKGVVYFTYRVDFDNQIVCNLTTAKVPFYGLMQGG
jgi:hypothetical protein